MMWSHTRVHLMNPGFGSRNTVKTCFMSRLSRIKALSEALYHGFPVICAGTRTYLSIDPGWHQRCVAALDAQIKVAYALHLSVRLLGPQCSCVSSARLRKMMFTLIALASFSAYISCSALVEVIPTATTLSTSMRLCCLLGHRYNSGIEA
jgi:hypothetical protein